MTDSSNDPLRRYDINRQVKAILTRHAVKLENLSISSSSSLVYLNGTFQKDSGHPFTTAEINAIFKEIEHVSHVKGIVADFENVVVANIDGWWTVVAKARPQQRLLEAEDDYTLPGKNSPSS